jgi:hypothetical protein
MIAEVGSVPGSIPHRLAAATGALYWNKPAPALPAPTAQARTRGTDQSLTVQPPVLSNNSALPSNRSARSICPSGDFTPTEMRGCLLPQAPLGRRTPAAGQSLAEDWRRGPRRQDIQPPMRVISAHLSVAARHEMTPVALVSSASVSSASIAAPPLAGRRPALVVYRPSAGALAPIPPRSIQGENSKLFAEHVVAGTSAWHRCRDLLATGLRRRVPGIATGVGPAIMDIVIQAGALLSATCTARC